MRLIWAFTKWCGRVLLWLLFWPAGLWRSWRHGANRRAEKAQGKVTVVWEDPAGDMRRAYDRAWKQGGYGGT